MKYLLSVLICSILFLSCKKETNQEFVYWSGEKSVIPNLTYGQDKQNTMDVYLSSNRNPGTKTIIFIHGGSWNEGDKSAYSEMASYFADFGINAVSVNYRYANAPMGVDYKAILSDIEQSILFLQSNTVKFGSNFNNITLFGGSAGGHLSLLFAYKMHNPNIKNVISLAGPTDFTDNAILAVNGMYGLIYNLIGSNDSTEWNDASPIVYTNNITTYLYHGKLDSIVPFSQSESLFKKIKSFNSRNKLLLFNNCGHEFSENAFLQIITETVQLINHK